MKTALSLITLFLLGLSLPHMGFSSSFLLLSYNVNATHNSALTTPQCRQLPQLSSYTLPRQNSVDQSDQTGLNNLFNQLIHSPPQALAKIVQTFKVDGRAYHTQTYYSLVRDAKQRYFAKGVWRNAFCQGDMIVIENQNQSVHIQDINTVLKGES